MKKYEVAKNYKDLKFRDRGLVRAYVNGEDIPGYTLEELEDNPGFMKHVMDYSNDTKMYDFCSDKVKGDFEFVKFLVQRFSSDEKFVLDAIDNFKDITDDELLGKDLFAMVRNNSFKKQHRDLNETDPRLLFGAIAMDIEQGCQEAQLSEELRKEGMEERFGEGFIFFKEKYAGCEGILESVASNMFYRIMSEKLGDRTLEDLYHINFATAEKAQEYGLSRFLVAFINYYDEALGDYLASHIDIASSYTKQFDNIISNWTLYEDDNLILKFQVFEEKVANYVEYGPSNSFDLYGPVYYFLEKNNMLDAYKKYILGQYDKDEDDIKLDDEHIEFEKESFEYLIRDKSNFSTMAHYRYFENLYNKIFGRRVYIEDYDEYIDKEGIVLDFNKSAKLSLKRKNKKDDK